MAGLSFLGGRIASSFPWEWGFRTAVALGRGVCIGVKLVEAFGGLRNYYYLCSAQAESRAVHGGRSPHPDVAWLRTPRPR